MSRTKGSKNRPKTNITKDYASQIVEKQEAIASLTTEIASITAKRLTSIEGLHLKEKKSALKKAEKEVASLEAKKAKADAKAAEEAKKAEAESSAEEAAGQRYERGRDSGKAEINKKTINKNKCRVDKLNSRSSLGIF